MSTIPIGTIISFAGPLANIPKDWLLCDGALLNLEKNPEYKPLFDAIGTTWGGYGDKFALPDLRGQFLRGVSGDSMVDPEKDIRNPSRPDLHNSGNKGNAVGSKQPDEVGSHSHNVTAP